MAKQEDTERQGGPHRAEPQGLLDNGFEVKPAPGEAVEVWMTAFSGSSGPLARLARVGVDAVYDALGRLTAQEPDGMFQQLQQEPLFSDEGSINPALMRVGSPLERDQSEAARLFEFGTGVCKMAKAAGELTVPDEEGIVTVTMPIAEPLSMPRHLLGRSDLPPRIYPTEVAMSLPQRGGDLATGFSVSVLGAERNPNRDGEFFPGRFPVKEIAVALHGPNNRLSVQARTWDRDARKLEQEPDVRLLRQPHAAAALIRIGSQAGLRV